jgi:hypothetical protein
MPWHLNKQQAKRNSIWPVIYNCREILDDDLRHQRSGAREPSNSRQEVAPNFIFFTSALSHIKSQEYIDHQQGKYQGKDHGPES